MTTYELTPIEPTGRIGFALVGDALLRRVQARFTATAQDWPDRLWSVVRAHGDCRWVLECDPPGYVPAHTLLNLITSASHPHDRAVWAYLAALDGDTPVVLRKVGSDEKANNNAHVG